MRHLRDQFQKIFRQRVVGLPILGEARARHDNFLFVRIVAALLVIYGHAKSIAPGVDKEDWFIRHGFGIYSGDIAVNSFFFLSGLMVSGSWVRRPLLLNFSKSRLLRLIPGFAFHLLLVAFVIGPILTVLPSSEYFANRTPVEYVLMNLKFTSDMIWKLPGVFGQNPKTSTINGSQWTLPAEFNAYVMTAIVGCIGLFSWPRLLAVLVIGTTLIAGATHPDVFPLHEDWFRLFGYFALGMLAFILRDRITISTSGFVIAILVAYLFQNTPLYLCVFAFSLSYILLWIGYGLPFFCRTLEKGGDPSYGIYLWGWFSQQIVALALPNAGLKFHVGLAMMIAVSCGYLSWHLVERRFLAWK